MPKGKHGRNFITIMRTSCHIQDVCYRRTQLLKNMDDFIQLGEPQSQFGNNSVFMENKMKNQNRQ